MATRSTPSLRAARSATRRAPTRGVERALWGRGHEVVVGLDEVGRGAWAGPLMVGAAVVPRHRRFSGVRDSKLLSEAQRERLFDQVAGWCLAWAVGSASQEECDELGMATAQRIAAHRALSSVSEQIGRAPDAAIADGTWDFVSPLVGHVEMRVRADATCLSVAAASILAKVTRDRLMRQLAEHYPWWSFETNKGYPCPRHRAALQGYGPSAVHRRTWLFMDRLVPWPGVARTVRPAPPTRPASPTW